MSDHAQMIQQLAKIEQLQATQVADRDVIIADLRAQHAEALSAVRIASKMLAEIETSAGVEASVALFRIQVGRALAALQGQKPDAPGCHPKLQLSMVQR